MLQGITFFFFLQNLLVKSSRELLKGKEEMMVSNKKLSITQKICYVYD